MKRVRALFFDFDSTLLDNRGYIDVLRATCRELSRAYPSIDSKALLIADNRIFLEMFSASEEDWTLGRIGGRELIRESWQQALREVGCRDNLVLEFLLAIHRRRDEAFYKLFDDVKPFIEKISRHGIPMALITNSSRDNQRPKIEILGIADWFESIVISGEVGKAKPDPGVFEIALREIGVNRTDVWHIGDSLETDVAGANAAGICSVWLNRFGEVRDPTSPKPDIVVSSLRELAQHPGLAW